MSEKKCSKLHLIDPPGVRHTFCANVFQQLAFDIRLPQYCRMSKHGLIFQSHCINNNNDEKEGKKEERCDMKLVLELTDRALNEVSRYCFFSTVSEEEKNESELHTEIGTMDRQKICVIT